MKIYLKHQDLNQRGLTLIGVLVALFVLVISVVAAAQLMARTQNTTSVSRERFVATNLAREGLELVQWVRDSNWLVGLDNWTGHPSQKDDPSSSLHGICDSSDDAEHKFTIERDTNGVGVYIDTDLNRKKLYLKSDGSYTHDEVTGGETSYSRVITVDCSQREAAVAYITVRSTVSWDNDNQSAVLIERLYNWYNKP